MRVNVGKALTSSEVKLPGDEHWQGLHKSVCVTPR